MTSAFALILSALPSGTDLSGGAPVRPVLTLCSPLIDRLISAFDPLEDQAICLRTWWDRRGNPVLFARRFFAEIQAIFGDMGARRLIGDYPDLVCEAPMPDDAVLTDVDTPEALAALKPAG